MRHCKVIKNWQGLVGYSAVLSGLVLLTAISGCLGLGFSEGDLERGVRDGLKKIPEAAQLDELFGKENVDHFVSYSGPSTSKKWNSEVYFGGRYALTMQVEVKMSSRLDRVVSVVGEPKFYLVKYKSIEEHSPGVFGGSTDQNPNIPYPFDVSTWKRIYDARGDVSLLDSTIDVHQEPLPHFDDFVKGKRSPRQKIRR